MQQTRPPCKCLICNFYSSDREFALGLLQTPPHDGRPCPLLTVPTAKPVVTFTTKLSPIQGKPQKTGNRFSKNQLPVFLFIIYVAILLPRWISKPRKAPWLQAFSTSKLSRGTAVYSVKGTFLYSLWLRQLCPPLHGERSFSTSRKSCIFAG